MKKWIIGGFSILMLCFITACNDTSDSKEGNESNQKVEEKTTEKESSPKKQEESIPQTFTDERDGKEYKVVKIGDQIWLAENLAYKPKSGNFWAYDNKEANVEQYGYLYDFATAQKVVPEGWHLPTKVELEALVAHYEKNTDKALEALTSDTEGLKIEYSGWWYMESHQFVHKGNEVGFWSSTTKGEKEAWLCILDGKFGHVHIRSRFKEGVGATVRLIKD